MNFHLLQSNPDLFFYSFCLFQLVLPNRKKANKLIYLKFHQVSNLIYIFFVQFSIFLKNPILYSLRFSSVFFPTVGNEFWSFQFSNKDIKRDNLFHALIEFTIKSNLKLQTKQKKQIFYFAKYSVFWIDLEGDTCNKFDWKAIRPNPNSTVNYPNKIGKKRTEHSKCCYIFQIKILLELKSIQFKF